MRISSVWLAYVAGSHPMVADKFLDPICCIAKTIFAERLVASSMILKARPF